MHDRIDVQAQCRLPPRSMNNGDDSAAVAAIARLVELSSRYAWLVILGFLLVAIASASYFTAHFVITSDTNKLISSSLPWRQQEVMLDLAFPHRVDRIVTVIEATTPEAAASAADALVNELSPRSDLIRTISRFDGGEFFERNGILFRSLDEVRRDTSDLISAQPFLGTLAVDPTLRGVFRTLSQSLEGVRVGKAKLDDLRPALAAIADALEALANGKTVAFSWRKLITGRTAEPSELRRFVDIQPVLHFGDLQPGGQATALIREAASRLGLTPDKGVKVRLTGSVVLSDEEFASIVEGTALNSAVTLLLVGLVLWLALKKARIISAVFINLMVGLVFTAAGGLWMVGAFNPISVAFGVLFVGLGVDFGIQFSVRYRSERHERDNLREALRSAARKAGDPLALAAAATAVGFFSFLPTSYRGLSELGLIAGCGMLIAFLCSITLVPAMLAVLNPPGEVGAIGFRSLAPVDEFLQRHRIAVVAGTILVVLAGTPLLLHLRFDFNPVDLQSPESASVVTYRELQHDPQTSGNDAEILAPSLEQADAMAKRLAALPEVSRVLTLSSFIPVDKSRKSRP